MKHSTWLLLPLSVFWFGCDSGGQSGGEVRDEDTGGPTIETDHCEEATTELSVDAVSPFGFSAADVLAYAEGRHAVQTEWLTEDEVLDMELSASGSTELTVETEYVGGQIRYVDSTWVHGDSGGLLMDIDTESACPDRLEIDVKVRVATADGALNENVEATLRASSPWVAELVVPLAPDELDGSLQLSVSSPDNAQITQLQLEAELGAGLFQGRLAGLVVANDGQVAMGAGFELLNWGPDVCQQSGLPIPVDAGSPAPGAMLEVVNGSGPFTMTWADGQQSELSLSVTSDETWACLQQSSDEVVLNAQMSATSGDGRLDSVLGVQLIGLGDGAGGFAQVQLLYNDYFAKAVPVAEFETQFGISGVDLSAYESATITFGTIYDTSSEPAATSGQLEVLGLTTADCATEQQEPEPGAAAPGCVGTTSTVVDSATW